MSDPSPLSYATFDADGLPAAVPAAEALIDDQAAPFALRPHFSSDQLTVNYVARSLRRRKAVDQVGDACEICGEPSGGQYVPMTWNVAMTRRTRRGGESRSNDVNVITHHAMCPHCSASFPRRFRLLRRLEWAADIAALSFPLMLVWLLGTLFTGRKPWDWLFPVFIGLFPICVIGSFISSMLTKRRRAENLPLAMMRSLLLAKVHAPAYRERPT